MNPLYIADFNYPLPDERIAKYPLPERDHSKLLIYRDGATTWGNISIPPHSLYIIIRA